MDPVQSSGAIPKRPLHQPEALQHSPSSQSSDEESPPLSHRKVVPMLSTLARERFVKLTDQERLERLDKLTDKEKAEFYLSFSPDDEFFKNKNNLKAVVGFCIDFYFLKVEEKEGALSKPDAVEALIELGKGYKLSKDSQLLTNYQKKCHEVDYRLGVLFIRLKLGQNDQQHIVNLLDLDSELLVQRLQILILMKDSRITTPTNNDYDFFCIFLERAKDSMFAIALWHAIKVALLNPSLTNVSLLDLVSFCNRELCFKYMGRYLVRSMTVCDEDVIATAKELPETPSLEQQTLYCYSNVFGKCRGGDSYEKIKKKSVIKVGEEDVRSNLPIHFFASQLIVESLDFCRKMGEFVCVLGKTNKKLNQDSFNAMEAYNNGRYDFVRAASIYFSYMKRMIGRKKEQPAVYERLMADLKRTEASFQACSVIEFNDVRFEDILDLYRRSPQLLVMINSDSTKRLIKISSALTNVHFCLTGMVARAFGVDSGISANWKSALCYLSEFAKDTDNAALLNDSGEHCFLFGDYHKSMEMYQCVLDKDPPESLKRHIIGMVDICKLLQFDEADYFYTESVEYTKMAVEKKHEDLSLLEYSASHVSMEEAGLKKEIRSTEEAEAFSQSDSSPSKQPGQEKMVVPLLEKKGRSETGIMKSKKELSFDKGGAVAPPGSKELAQTEIGYFKEFDYYRSKLNKIRKGMDLEGERDWINHWVEHAKNSDVRARVKLDASGFYLRQLSACGREFLLKGHEDPVVQARMTRRYAVSALNDLLGINLKGNVSPDQLKDILLGCYRDNPDRRHNRWLCSCLRSVCSLMAHSYSEQGAVSYRKKKVGGQSLYRQYYQLKTIADPFYQPQERSLPESKVQVVTPEVFEQLKLQDS